MPRSVKRLAPLSVRLNEAERAELARRAGAVALSTYVKAKALGGDLSQKPERRRPDADRVLLSQILGQLGASGLSVSLRKLAEAAESGSLYVDARTASELRQACGHVQDMNTALMGALHGRVKPPVPTRLDELFNSLNSDWEQAP